MCQGRPWAKRDVSGLTEPHTIFLGKNCSSFLHGKKLVKIVKSNRNKEVFKSSQTLVFTLCAGSLNKTLNRIFYREYFSLVLVLDRYFHVFTVGLEFEFVRDLLGCWNGQ